MFSWSRNSTTAAEDRIETGRPPATAGHHFVKNEDNLLKIERTKLLQNATVDVRHSRAVHVTTKCVHGVSGGMCGATHCGLGAVLPLPSNQNTLDSFSQHNSYPTTVSESVSYPRVSSLLPESSQELRYSAKAETVFDDISDFNSLPTVSRRLTVDVSALDDILADVDVVMENKTTTQWKSSFQNMREKFRAGTPPRELQLAVDAAQTLPKNYSPSLMTDSMESPDSPRTFSPVVKSQSEKNVPTTIAELTSNNGVKPLKRTYKEVRQELLRSEYLKMPTTAANVRQQQQLDLSNGDSKKRVSNFWVKSVANKPDTTEDLQSEDEKPKLLQGGGKPCLEEAKYFSDYSTNSNTKDLYQGATNVPLHISTNSGSDTLSPKINFSEINSLIGDDGQDKNSQSPQRNGRFQPSSDLPLQNELSHANIQRNPSSRIPFSSANDTLNFSELDSAVEAVNSLGVTNKKQNGTKQNGASRQPQGFKASSIAAVQLMNNMSQYLQKSAEILSQDSMKPKVDSDTFDFSTVLDVPAESKTSQIPTLSVSHSPSPDTSSTTSDAPVGLPHPKPKHHLREQLQSIGLEPRSPTNFNRGTSVGWSFSNLGAVAERVQQFEKFPTKQLRAAEAALNSESLKSFFGKGAESIYKAKPVIHVNFWRKGDRQGLEKREKNDNYLSENLVPLQNQQPTVSSPISNLPVSYLSQKYGSESADKKTPKSPAQFGQRSARKATEQNIPRFYFPKGRPVSPSETNLVLKKVSAVFAKEQNARLSEEQMDGLMKACDFPLYWKKVVFLACGGGQKGFLTLQDFTHWWKLMGSETHDEASRFVYTLVGPKRSFLLKEDFEPLIQDVVETFPGLYFLRDAPEFHSRYIQTVIARIFFGVNRSWSGKISALELRNSNFLEVLGSLETVEDINLVTDYFSYEHFYVIYCKFWELDRDHDLFIDRHDLSRHDNGAISMRIIERMFSGAVNRGLRGESGAKERLSYADFVSFLIAEEDKRHPTSMEYWFRCLDKDGDGVLSMYELHDFYEEQERKMMAMSIEPMGFNDVLCQMLDIVRPREEGKIRLGDLKRCRMTPHFLNAFINVHKYYDQESSETERASVRSESGEEISDWDRFCAEEYEALMQEEQMGQETEINCDDDSDSEVDQYLSMSAPEATRVPMSILDTL